MAKQSLNSFPEKNFYSYGLLSEAVAANHISDMDKFNFLVTAHNKFTQELAGVNEIALQFFRDTFNKQLLSKDGYNAFLQKNKTSLTPLLLHWTLLLQQIILLKRREENSLAKLTMQTSLELAADILKFKQKEISMGTYSSNILNCLVATNKMLSDPTIQNIQAQQATTHKFRDFLEWAEPFRKYRHFHGFAGATGILAGLFLICMTGIAITASPAVGAIIAFSAIILLSSMLIAIGAYLLKAVKLREDEKLRNQLISNLEELNKQTKSFGFFKPQDKQSPELGKDQAANFEPRPAQI